MNRRIIFLCEPDRFVPPESLGILAVVAGNVSNVGQYVLPSDNRRLWLSEVLIDILAKDPQVAVIWIVNANVAADWITLNALVAETEDFEPQVAYHGSGGRQSLLAGLLESPVSMIGSALIARLRSSCGTPSLIEECLEHLADQLGSSEGDPWIHFAEHPGLRRFFRNFPEEGKPGVRWPVSNVEEAREIWMRYSDLIPHAGMLGVSYCNPSARAWYRDDAKRWIRWFSSDEPKKVLHIRCGTGADANVLLDCVFPNPGSAAHLITDFSGGDGSPELSVDKCGAERQGQLHLYEGLAIEVLAWMITTEGFWESFDFIMLSSAPDGVGTLCHACLAWHLLKPGAILIFDGDSSQAEPSMPSQNMSIESFMSAHATHADLLHSSDRVVLRKARELIGSSSASQSMAVTQVSIN